MTNQEAYKWLCIHFAPCGDGTKQDEAISIALEAISKQIPRKPMVIIDVDNKSLWHLYCPTCGDAVGKYSKRLKITSTYNITNSKICAQCGQRLDLELQEEE